MTVYLNVMIRYSFLDRNAVQLVVQAFFLCYLARDLSLALIDSDVVSLPGGATIIHV